MCELNDLFFCTKLFLLGNNEYPTVDRREKFMKTRGFILWGNNPSLKKL